ncbi:hypothetical protein ACKKBG_A19405 [Auxenochlorella protothecoides x Auxenochlorella symbiontica]
MTSSKEVVLEYVVPTLGAVTAVLMFLASMPAVLRARKSGELGELNLIPYPAIVANCVGWVAYAMVVANGFVLGPNAIGLVLGLLYIFACAGLAPQRTLDAMGAVTVLFTVVLVSAGAVGTFRHLDHAALRLLWGYTSNAILLCYYATPMSTLYHVLCERRADSLSLPLCAMNALNGALWLAYGLAIHDPFLWVPNGVGMIIALVLLAAILVFWRNRGVATPTLEPDMCAGEDGGGVCLFEKGEGGYGCFRPCSLAGMGILACRELTTLIAKRDAPILYSVSCLALRPAGCTGAMWHDRFIIKDPFLKPFNLIHSQPPHLPPVQ